MKQIGKIISFVLAILMIVSTVLFVSFEAKEINHECKGEDCPICYQISVYKDTVKSKINLLSTALLAICLIVYKVNVSYDSCFSNKTNTLVTLGVELLD